MQVCRTACSLGETGEPRSGPQSMAKWCLLAILLAGSSIVLSGCGHASLDPRPDADIAPQHLFMFKAMHAAAPVSGQEQLRIDLGRRLYYDVHLSENGSVSCNSCHQLDQYGVDPGKAVSIGHDKRPGGRNSPTVYNAGLQFVQFWDGRAATLAEQAAGPMLNPVEMGMSGQAAVLTYIHSRPEYLRQFHEAYPGSADPATFDHVTDAIAAFEAGLQTPGRWDKYLEGDAGGLTEAEKQGLRVFLRTGCAACHAGVDMGGNSYEQLGAAHNWPDKSDQGRGGVTHRPNDAMYFKVPTLRNVEKTGPWFHNGQVKTLDDAVRQMARYEAGQRLSDADVQSIVTFLHALTGTIPQQYIQMPPASSTAANHSGPSRGIRPIHTSPAQEGQ